MTSSRDTPTYRRNGGRAEDALRPVTIELGFQKFAEGSALIRCGDTHVLAAASIEKRVPPFLRDSGRGWVTAEYSMLPRSTHTRVSREVARGKVSGRTAEIQRLIGRSLRAVVDMKKLRERTITVDCDVLQADGGTRTASITAAYVALVAAASKAFLAGDFKDYPVREPVSAVSVGICDDCPLLDLEYAEDSVAQVDLNVVMTGSGDLVEVQGTGEQRGFSRQEFDRLLDLAMAGARELMEQQRLALAELHEQVREAAERRGRGPKRPRAKDERELWS